MANVRNPCKIYVRFHSLDNSKVPPSVPTANFDFSVYIFGNCRSESTGVSFGRLQVMLAAWNSERLTTTKLQELQVHMTCPKLELCAFTSRIGLAHNFWRGRQIIPVVPHKAVAEVSRIGNYRRDWLL